MKIRKPRLGLGLATVTAAVVLAAGGGYVASAATNAPATAAPTTVTHTACVTYGPTGSKNATGNVMQYDWNGTACPKGTYAVKFISPATPAPKPIPPTPTPTPTNPTPTPTPTNPTPTPTPTGSVTSTSALAGNLGPYLYPGINAGDGYTTYVANNMWGCGSIQPPASGAFCGVQTVTATDPGNWSVTSDQADGNTAVLTYPDVTQIFTNGDDVDPPISGFTSITSTYDQTMPTGKDTDAEAAYDIWLDNGGPKGASYEVMIWVDNEGQTPAGSVVGTYTIGGNTYQVWNGDGMMSFVLTQNENSGSVDILSVLNWLETQKYVEANSALGIIQFGWEICSTGGVPETFKVTGYTLTTSPADG